MRISSLTISKKTLVLIISEALLPLVTFSCEVLMGVLMQLGPKVEDVKKPVNKFVFLSRLILGAIAGAYFVLIPIYMWLKDKIVPKGWPI